MTTHKNIDKICCVILALSLILTVLFMNAESFGIKPASTVKGYESRLFSTSSVHSINIVMDDWDEFLTTCTNEEYAQCTVIVDNEAYKNVAIRAKGNTSLTQVQNYGNNRYSFKIEFDHYDSTNTYYGLDKLSLNNIIQDNTYMKDFLTYQMMGYFGVNAPLCSYVQILVNGEEWGLYLAVEGVEESFLERNFGNNYGELYKPDSMSMGGGRGNGGKFDMKEWDAEQESENDSSNNMEQTIPEMGMQTPPGGGQQFGGQQGGLDGMGQQPGGQQQGGGMNPRNMELSIDQIKTMIQSLEDTKLQSLAELLGYDNAEAMLTALDSAKDTETFLNGKTVMELMDYLFRRQNGGFGQGGMAPPPDMNGGNFFGGMNGAPENGGRMGGMGSSDVSLIYSDDEYESYSNIFDNAKTDITDADKDRLIDVIKQLNENSSIEDVVNVEKVIRYFVVHNFVCNFDSYTGSMIHNYYLYEEDGQLSLIPWDYNLAYGGFVGGSDATGLVNYPIDSPVSGGTTDSRPMLSWIFESEEYTELYHQYFAEFISDYFDSGYFAQMIDSVKTMIAPFVESDPTKFCTYEEFEAGIDTLKEFCLLRAKSVTGQLTGTISATSEEQSKDTLVDASHISIPDMGSMNNSMGGGMNKPGDQNSGMRGQAPTNNNQQRPTGPFPQNGGNAPEIPQGNGQQDFPQGGNGQNMTPPNGKGEYVGNEATAISSESYIILGISGIVLIVGLSIAILYKKRF